jgi:hypothetical protein
MITKKPRETIDEDAFAFVGANFAFGMVAWDGVAFMQARGRRQLAFML